MVNIVKIADPHDASLDLTFSDGSHGRWSADMIARDTVLTAPLNDAAYFARAFIEAGALTWPNGLELSPSALHHRLGEAGLLVQPGVAAE
jgi:hypothetical protein